LFSYKNRIRFWKLHYPLRRINCRIRIPQINLFKYPIAVEIKKQDASLQFKFKNMWVVNRAIFIYNRDWCVIFENTICWKNIHFYEILHWKYFPLLEQLTQIIQLSTVVIISTKRCFTICRVSNIAKQTFFDKYRV